MNEAKKADGVSTALSIKVIGGGNGAAALNDLINHTLLKENKVPIVVCDSSGGSHGMTAQDWLAMAAQEAGADPNALLEDRTVNISYLVKAKERKYDYHSLLQGALDKAMSGGGEGGCSKFVLAFEQ